MAPLPANNTDRYFLDYTVSGFSHTLEMRSDPAGDPAGAITALDAFMTAISGQLHALSIDGLRFQLAHAAVSLPLTWTGPASYGSGVGDPGVSAVFVGFIGRSGGGRRVRNSVFGGVNVVVGGDYRVSSSEAAYVAGAITALTADPLYWLAIDGLVPTWHTYANIGVNAYWRNKIR